MAAPAPPRFQANLNFNAIMSKMEQNVKNISSAFKIKKTEKKESSVSKGMHTYFGDEEILNSLPPGYYQEGYDAITDTLTKMPADFDDAYLDKLIEEKESVLEVLNGRLFTRVMNSYNAFVQGMTQIGELSNDLLQTTIMCKNGRRNLQMVKDKLTRGGFMILSIFRRRQNIALIIQDLLAIRSLLVYQQELQELVNQGDYPKTIDTCLEARKTVTKCSKFVVVKELDMGLQGSYNQVLERLDKALVDCCRNFQPANYEKVISAYKLLGTTTRIVEKLQTNFTEPIESEAKRIALADALLSPENAAVAEILKRHVFFLLISIGTHNNFFILENHSESCVWR